MRIGLFLGYYTVKSFGFNLPRTKATSSTRHNDSWLLDPCVVKNGGRQRNWKCYSFSSEASRSCRICPSAHDQPISRYVYVSDNILVLFVFNSFVYVVQKARTIKRQYGAPLSIKMTHQLIRHELLKGNITTNFVCHSSILKHV